MGRHAEPEDVSGAQPEQEKMPAQSPSIPGPTYENPNADDADQVTKQRNEQRASE